VRRTRRVKCQHPSDKTTNPGSEVHDANGDPLTPLPASRAVTELAFTFDPVGCPDVVVRRNLLVITHGGSRFALVEPLIRTCPRLEELT